MLSIHGPRGNIQYLFADQKDSFSSFVYFIQHFSPLPHLPPLPPVFRFSFLFVIHFYLCNLLKHQQQQQQSHASQDTAWAILYVARFFVCQQAHFTWPDFTSVSKPTLRGQILRLPSSPLSWPDFTSVIKPTCEIQRNKRISGFRHRLMCKVLGLGREAERWAPRGGRHLPEGLYPIRGHLTNI